MADQEQIDIILKGQFKDGKLVIDQTKQLQGNLDSIDKSTKQVDKSANAFNSTLKKIATFTGFALLANQAKNLVKGSLEAAGSMEQVNVALTTMLGSGEKAAKLQKDLIKFAKSTPFEIEGIFGTTKQLLAFGIAQEEMIPTMKTLGNIASGLGVPMSRLALVFGQVKAAGHLMGQDLLQFTNAGVPLLDELSKMLGKSKAEVMKLKEQGKISFEQVKAALENMAGEGGRFFNLMEKQSQTFLGTVSNLSDGFFGVKNALGNALLPVAKEVVNSMMASFVKLAALIESNKETITAFARGFVTAIGYAIVPLKLLIGLISNFIGGINKITTDMSPATKVVMTITVALSGLAASLGLLSKVAIVARTAFLALSTVIAANPFAAAIIGVIGLVSAGNYLIDNWDDIKRAGQVMALQIEKSFTELKATFEDLIVSILDKLSLLANVPGFDWIDETRDKFENLRNDAISSLTDIENQLQQLQQSSDIGISANQEEVDPKQKYEEELAAFQEAQTLKNELELEMQATQDEAKLSQLQMQLAAVELTESESATRIAQLKSQTTQRSFEQEKAARIKQYQSNLKMDSDGYKAAQGAANELVALQNSKNKELAAIGKAAAIFQITNDTARGAMSAYASLAGIPIVGPGLGAAAAAAVIAYGAERIASTANSFAVGTPEIPEDQMAMVHQGEMIIPATFSDAIRSGDLSLSGGSQDQSIDGEGNVNIINVGAGDIQNQDIGTEAQDKVAKNAQDNEALLAQNEEFLTAKQEQEALFAEENPDPLTMPIDEKIAKIDQSNQVELAGLAKKNAGELIATQKQNKALLDERKKNDKANQDQDKANELFRQKLKEAQLAFDYAQLSQASKNQAQSSLTSIRNDGASGAQAAYKAMAGIPYVGPVLGAQAAAQVLAHAQQRAAEVNSFAVGTANVPNDQLAQIHAGEMIVPSDFASSIRNGEITLGGDKGGDTINLAVNFSFEESQFVEDRDKFITEMTDRMAQLIYEDVIPAIPTREA